MAVFSNLEGTMKKSFFLGKNGARLETDGSVLEIKDYANTGLLPVSAAEPSAPTHLVTLQFMQAHASSSALSGTTVPAQSLGVDGNVYYQVNATNIVQIYIKNGGIWKPFSGGTPPTDTGYVSSFTVEPTDFVQNGQLYTYTLPESVHARGSSILAQLQDLSGNTTGAEITLDNAGNINVSVLSVPTSNLTLAVIGATSLTTPFSKGINKIDWVQSGSEYTLTILATEHGQAIGTLYFGVYENVTDAAASQSPFSLVTVDSKINESGDVVFTSAVAFSGKVVISGI